MNTVIRTYNEKYFYDKECVSDFGILLDKNICEEKNGQIIFNVTGLYIIKSQVYAIFPYGYKIENEKKNIFMLLDLFAILHKEEKLNPNECKDIEIEYKGRGELISIAYEIMKDYRENGYVQIQHIVEGINIGGKISWKKTVRLKNNMFNDDGMPVYSDFVSRHSAVNQNALLKSLHLYTINKSIAMFGFLFGIDNNFDEQDIQLPVEKNYALHFLKSEKNNTFNTRLLKVIDLLIKFLESSEKESNDNTVGGVSTKTFYAVWELMCKKVFKDEYNTYSQTIPRPYWKENNKKPWYTEQIPDILYKEGTTLYILDAKYYNLKKNRPGWHDLVKQYFYEMSLKAVMNDVKFVYNTMIIPGDSDDLIEYWAFSRVENVPDFGQVFGVKVNMKSVINDFCYGSKHNYRKNLTQCLENCYKD